jgi:hypothetical protein
MSDVDSTKALILGIAQAVTAGLAGDDLDEITVSVTFGAIEESGVRHFHGFTAHGFVCANLACEEPRHVELYQMQTEAYRYTAEAAVPSSWERDES